MHPAIPGLIFLAILVVVVFRAALKPSTASRDWRAMLEALAAKHDLTCELSGAHGKVAGLRLVIDTYTRKVGSDRMTYRRARVLGCLPAAMTLTHEGFGSIFSKAFVGEDINVGAPVFDEQFVVRGTPEVDIVSRLGSRARAALIEADQRGLRVDAGDLVWEMNAFGQKKDKLDRAIAALRAAATELVPTAASVPGRLLHGVMHDAEPDYRALALRTLIAEHPDAKETITACTHSLGDSRAEVRLVAAGHLTTEAAYGVLCALAVDVTLPDALRIKAVGAWSAQVKHSADRSGAEAWLIGHLGDLPPASPLLAPALRVAEAHGVAVPSPLLRRLLGDAAVENVAAAIACTRLSKDPAMLQAVVAKLTDDEDTLRIEACKVLGDIATTSVVASLLTLTLGMFAKGDVKRAASAAILAIQARSEGAHAGQLALAPDTGGQLSAASAEVDALSRSDS